MQGTEISDEVLNSLTTAIHKRYGIDFTSYESKSLRRGFGRIILKNNFSSVLELWSKIMADRGFFLNCIDELTVNLTEMFRNVEIWQKMEGEILPELSKKFSLNIWHAGCSSGEEVYTMAIILNRLNMLTKTKLLGTDLSAKMIEQAKKGEYSSMLMTKYIRSMRSFTTGENVEDNFDFHQDSATIKPFLTKRISFMEQNLVHDKVDQKFNLIFCRNVMIYFDDNLKMQVLEKFYNSLQDDGYFVIGYYDMLPKESAHMFEVYDSKTRIYKKKIR